MVAFKLNKMVDHQFRIVKIAGPYIRVHTYTADGIVDCGSIDLEIGSRIVIYNDSDEITGMYYVQYMKDYNDAEAVIFRPSTDICFSRNRPAPIIETGIRYVVGLKHRDVNRSVVKPLVGDIEYK